MRADAVAQILRAFPVGWLWSLPLRMPGLRALANWGYDLFSRRRESISTWRGAGRVRAARAPVVVAGAPSCAGGAVAVARRRRSSPRRRSSIARSVAGRRRTAGGRRSRAALAVVAPPIATAPAAERSAVVELPPPAVAPGAAAKTSAPFLQQLRTLVWALREVVVLAFIVTMVSETLYINAAVPKFLKHEQPLWIKRMVAYPRLIQAWSMFASDAPTTDQSMVVDAVTVDGRHVDPYSEATSRYANPGRNEIPVRLDNDSFVFNYSGRIPSSGAYSPGADRVDPRLSRAHRRSARSHRQLRRLRGRRRQPADRRAEPAQRPQPRLPELPAQAVAYSRLTLSPRSGEGRDGVHRRNRSANAPLID